MDCVAAPFSCVLFSTNPPHWSKTAWRRVVVMRNVRELRRDMRACSMHLACEKHKTAVTDELSARGRSRESCARVGGSAKCNALIHERAIVERTYSCVRSDVSSKEQAARDRATTRAGPEVKSPCPSRFDSVILRGPRFPCVSPHSQRAEGGAVTGLLPSSSSA